MQIKTSKPATFYIKFTESNPSFFKLFYEDGEVNYFRYLDGKTPRIKFNIVEPGVYFSETPFEVVKVTDIELPESLPELPKPDRARFNGNFKAVVNPNLTGVTPIIYSNEGLVEVPEGFLHLPKPIQRFLVLHEKAHFFYSKEEDCDLFALVNYLREGYNRSMAFYSLSHILSRNPENTKRLYNIFNQIQKTQKNKL